MDCSKRLPSLDIGPVRIDDPVILDEIAMHDDEPGDEVQLDLDGYPVTVIDTARTTIRNSKS